MVQAGREGGMGGGESSGNMGREEQRETDLRHSYQVELTGLNEGFVTGGGGPVGGRNHE